MIKTYQYFRFLAISSLSLERNEILSAYKQNKMQFWHKKFTNLMTAFFACSSPFSETSFRALGSTFQNSLTNSLPLRLLFCKISLARYRKDTWRSFWQLLKSFSHVSTTCLAFFRWKMHQCDRAICCQRKHRTNN